MKKFVIIDFFHQNWWGKINFDEFRAKIRNYTILIFPFLNSKCLFKKLKKINFDAFLGKNSKCIFANKIKNIYRSWAKNHILAALKLFPKIELLDIKLRFGTMCKAQPKLEIPNFFRREDTLTHTDLRIQSILGITHTTF